ncbi:MAG: c-type cytochrome [Solirubrobacterales bacterium]|nr:c-type cytochrome [Solirubrobacterales bacterium]
MNKRAFIYFGLVALLLVIVIPLWAFNKDGSESSSPEKVAASDEAARQLFVTNCGTCHTLDRAGTHGVVGPNLDDRLAAAGPATDQAAVDATQQRVMTAIQQGVGNGAMPAGILEGSNAQTVANFVARVAGQ